MWLCKNIDHLPIIIAGCLSLFCSLLLLVLFRRKRSSQKILLWSLLPLTLCDVALSADAIVVYCLDDTTNLVFSTFNSFFQCGIGGWYCSISLSVEFLLRGFVASEIRATLPYQHIFIWLVSLTTAAATFAVRYTDALGDVASQNIRHSVRVAFMLLSLALLLRLLLSLRQLPTVSGKVIKMMLPLVGVFIVTWLPTDVVSLVDSVSPDGFVPRVVVTVADTMASSSGAVNLLVWIWLGRQQLRSVSDPSVRSVSDVDETRLLPDDAYDAASRYEGAFAVQARKNARDAAHMALPRSLDSYAQEEHARLGDRADEDFDDDTYYDQHRFEQAELLHPSADSPRAWIGSRAPATTAWR